jgi:hypothetical protein
VSAIILVAAALGLAAMRLIVSARFAGSFGYTEEASILLSGLGICIDVLAIMLPTVAMRLWKRRQWAASSTA